MKTSSTGNAAPEGRRGKVERRAPSILPLWLALGLAGLAGAAQLHLAGHLPLALPGCLWRKFCGIPCPSCGVTRSLAAWTHLDLAAAFRFHPLCFLACLGLVAWAGLSLVDRWTGRPWTQALLRRGQAWPIWPILGALALLNWVYLILTLPP